MEDVLWQTTHSTSDIVNGPPSAYDAPSFPNNCNQSNQGAWTLRHSQLSSFYCPRARFKDYLPMGDPGKEMCISLCWKCNPLRLITRVQRG